MLLYFSLFVNRFKTFQMQLFAKNFAKFIPPCTFTTGKQFADSRRNRTSQYNNREY